MGRRSSTPLEWPVLASAAVVVHLAVPTLVLTAMAVVSLLARPQGPASLGLRRPRSGTAGQVIVLTVSWTVLQMILLPQAEHLTGQRQDGLRWR